MNIETPVKVNVIVAPETKTPASEMDELVAWVQQLFEAKVPARAGRKQAPAGSARYSVIKGL